MDRILAEELGSISASLKEISASLKDLRVKAPHTTPVIEEVKPEHHAFMHGVGYCPACEDEVEDEDILPPL